MTTRPFIFPRWPMGLHALNEKSARLPKRRRDKARTNQTSSGRGSISVLPGERNIVQSGGLTRSGWFKWDWFGTFQSRSTSSGSAGFVCTLVGLDRPDVQLLPAFSWLWPPRTRRDLFSKLLKYSGVTVEPFCTLKQHPNTIRVVPNRRH